jgi:hypothetical protein
MVSSHASGGSMPGKVGHVSFHFLLSAHPKTQQQPFGIWNFYDCSQTLRSCRLLFSHCSPFGYHAAIRLCSLHFPRCLFYDGVMSDLICNRSIPILPPGLLILPETNCRSMYDLLCYFKPLCLINRAAPPSPD